MPDGFMDLRGVHGGQDGVIFATLNYRSSKGGKGELRYGADGPVKVWVNGREVDCRPQATNPAVAGAFKPSVTWKKGNNSIMFALATNAGKAWGLFCGIA